MTFQKRFVNLMALLLMVVGFVQLIVNLVWWRDWRDIYLGAFLLALGSGARLTVLASRPITGWKQHALVWFWLCMPLAAAIFLIVGQLGH
jgi:hypothetical protein